MDNTSEQHGNIEAARAAMSRGDAAEAERLLVEAIDAAERELGAEHPSLALPLNELSRLYIRRADHWHAEIVLQRLVQIAGAKGERHPDVATALAGLAVAKRGLGDDAAAEQLYRRALSIREEVLAPSHMTIVVTLEQLAATCAARGNQAEALALLQRALPRRVCAVGAEHETVRALRERIAELEGRPAEAIPAATASADPVVETPVIAEASSEVTPAAPKRRKARFVWKASAAIVLLAIGGFAARSLAVKDSQSDTPETTTESRMSLVASASVSKDDYTAPLPTTAQRLAAVEASVAKPIASVALPTLRKVIVPTIAMPNADSVMRASAKGAHDAAPEMMRPSQSLGAPSPVEDGVVTPPVMIGSAPAPHFPDELRAQGLEGEVVVRFRVDETGHIDRSSMQVVQSPHALFTAAVRNVLSKFRFEPAHAGRESKPQAAWVQFSTQFASRN